MSPRREDFGAWLEGTPAGRSPGQGSEVRIPASGAGSAASLLRRGVALAIDWALSMAVASVFWPDPSSVGPRLLGAQPLATLLVFVLSTVVLVGLLGHTIGHRLLGLRVARLVGGGSADAAVRVPAPGPPGPARAALRTVLLALVIPAVVWDRSGRGMHDVAARTMIVRR